MGRKAKTLVSVHHLPGFLLASESECERWIEAGLIPVADRKPIRQWGRMVEVRLFDPDQVAALAAKVPDWRREDDAEVRGRRSDATRRRDTEGSDRTSRGPGDAAHRRRKAILTALRAKTEHAIADPGRASPGSADSPDGDEAPPRDFAGYRVDVRFDLPALPGGTIPVPFQLSVAEPPEVAERVLRSGPFPAGEAEAAADTLDRAVTRRRKEALDACEQALAAWRDELDTYLSAYEDEDRLAILQGIRSAAGRLAPLPVPADAGPEEVARLLRTALDELRSRATARRLRHLREAQIRAASGYETYAAIFPLARSLDRQVLFLAGPTNSGKTHEALRLASEAPSAEILSPLRLLALEHYERLGEGGLAAGMITGEERQVPEGATHIARTIETLDLGRAVDVCVIDEVQMLGDPSRGWAWTQAIVGAPARLVVLTGAPEAIPLVEHLLAMTGEPLKVRILKRKGELQVEPGPVDLHRLGRGDALIAFSRAEIHDLRTRLVRAGRSVATVYGALGPEVRRAEAARFRNQEAEVLVATDAIGMGLNIGPLRRVVFSTLSKFDGVQRRQLLPMEIKQIAGRAGRFGHHEVGFVSALTEAGPFRHLRGVIDEALTREAPRLRGKAYVRPNHETVLSASRVLGSDRLGPVLQYLNDTLVAGHPDLRMADMAETIELARALDAIALPILDRLAYAIAPVDTRDGLAVDMLLSWADQHARRGTVEAPNFGVNTDLLKLEARVKIATSWLWLGQRYPEVYGAAADVVQIRSHLNAKIEEKLVASSTARLKGRGTPGRETGRRGRARSEGRRGPRSAKAS